MPGATQRSSIYSPSQSGSSWRTWGSGESGESKVKWAPNYAPSCWSLQFARLWERSARLWGTVLSGCSRQWRNFAPFRVILTSIYSEILRRPSWTLARPSLDFHSCFELVDRLLTFNWLVVPCYALTLAWSFLKIFSNANSKVAQPNGVIFLYGPSKSNFLESRLNEYGSFLYLCARFKNRQLYMNEISNNVRRKYLTCHQHLGFSEDQGQKPHLLLL